MSQTPAQIDTVISSSPSADMNDVDQDHELSAEEESDISDDEPAGASPSDRVRRNLRDDKSNMTQLNGDDESINAAGLGPFDWQDFEQRFEDEMAQAEAKEQEISQEFGDLVQYFRLWSAASAHHDNERAFKRLKTREAFVQHSEDKLERKRQHHEQIVEAFSKAFALFGSD